MPHCIRCAWLKDDASPKSPSSWRDAPERRLREEPPVVARLVVEIRSDGSRTIARGALEDAQRGERVAIEARGDSPIQLAIALARSLTRLPTACSAAVTRRTVGCARTSRTPPR